MSEKPSEAEAQKLLDWVADLDPAWRSRIEAMREERHSSPLQAVAILACWTLESGHHMEIPILEQLLDGFAPSGAKAICEGCDQEWTLEYPGQPFCSNLCAEVVRGAQAASAVSEAMKTGRPRLGPRSE